MNRNFLLLAVHPGVSAINKEVAKKQQMTMLEEASDVCQKLQRQLHQSQLAGTAAASTSDASNAIEGEVTALVNSLSMLRKIVENQEVHHLCTTRHHILRKTSTMCSLLASV